MRVSPCQFPASMIADFRQMPAVPLKLIQCPALWRAVCSIMKCESRKMAWHWVRRESSRLMCCQRVWMKAMLSGMRCGMVFSRKSGLGMKSASKMAMNSYFAAGRASLRAPALKPMRFLRCCREMS